MTTNADSGFFSKLEERLIQPLPGRKAQLLMAASCRGKKEFDWEIDSPPVKSSVLLMLFEREGDLCFPLIQRPFYNGVHSGQIALPGGKEEYHDRNRTATALRETHEEIGVDTRDVKIIGSLSPLYIQASNYDVFPVIGLYPSVPVYHPDPSEVSEVLECCVSELKDEKIRKIKDMLIREKFRIQAPYFDIGNKTVWGATAMILSEFIEILKDIE